MIRRMFRQCGHAPGTLSPEDQAVVDAFRSMLAAVREPEPWTSGRAQDVSVRVGPFIERAHTRPGYDHGPAQIAVALVHPETPHVAAYAHRYTSKGWLRCETNTILGVWQPAYAMLTHAAACLPLPDDFGMAPAHYGVHVEARRPDGTGCTLLRLGPYTQTWLAFRDADRLNTELEGRAAPSSPGSPSPRRARRSTSAITRATAIRIRPTLPGCWLRSCLHRSPDPSCAGPHSLRREYGPFVFLALMASQVRCDHRSIVLCQRR
ncbi:hypothetical protein [Streptomyces sp. NBC_01443]|uniref:hypothetical protein n=1 Tax=Streptomyces sp. NBC_01443 TaxID=2903868 RepID=UPI0022518B36|nr:hypothetical protein [Streptomyces sp. NBC_01443]MCX4633359.1 hypothetical protein [Streptomyces sp. NBC_01443]